MKLELRVRCMATIFWMLPGVVAHAGNVTYIYTDPQGTPLAETDAAGNVTATFDYRAYGAQALGAVPSGPGYTGHVSDPDLGLFYMQARYYDPAIGGFLSVDASQRKPGGAMSFGRYQYAEGNPVSNTDPDGNTALCDGVFPCEVYSSGYNQITSKGQAGYLAARFFNHYDFQDLEKGTSSKTSLPKETKEALVKIIMSPFGSRLLSTMSAASRKIDLVQTVWMTEAFTTYGDQIVYTPSVGAFIYSRANGLWPGDGSDNTSLDILLFHEIGHTDIGQLAFGFKKIIDDNKFNVREETRAVKSFENPYRAYLGVARRCTYFVENDMCN